VADRVAILLAGRLLRRARARGGGLGERLRLRVRGEETAVLPASRGSLESACECRHGSGAERRDLLRGRRDGAMAEALATAVVAAASGSRHGTAPVTWSASFLGLNERRPSRARHMIWHALQRKNGDFSSPIAYTTVSVYLLLMGYTFTAISSSTGRASSVRIFFQAAVLLLLIVPWYDAAFAEELRTGTLEFS